VPSSASSITTREDLRESIIQKNIFPLYLFHGDETYLMDEMTELLVGQVLNEASRNFNYDVIDEADARHVVGIVTAFPLESDRRVVVVKDLEKIDNAELLLPIFERPVDTSVFILRTPKADFRTKMYRALQKSAAVVSFRYLYENEINQWIAGRIKKAGKEISAEASELLQSYSGRSLRDISNEIEKLMIFVGDRNTIGTEDISAVVGMSREFNIFELQKTFARKDVASALKISQNMLEAGEQPVKIVSMLTKYFLNIWVFQEMSGQNVPDAEIAKFLKVKEFNLREYRAASRIYSPDELENCFRTLLAADEALKNSRPSSVVLSIVAYSVIRGKPETDGSFQRNLHS